MHRSRRTTRMRHSTWRRHWAGAAHARGWSLPWHEALGRWTALETWWGALVTGRRERARTAGESLRRRTLTGTWRTPWWWWAALLPWTRRTLAWGRPLSGRRGLLLLGRRRTVSSASTGTAHGSVSKGDWCWRCVLLCGLDDLVVEKVECGAKDDPLDAVFVALSQGLPNGLFFGGLACDTDTGPSTVGSGWVLLDLAKLDTFRRNVMAGISKVEHGPEGGVWIGFRDLEEGEVRGVWRGERELVDG